MNFIIFALYDRKSDTFHTPFFAAHEVTAKRHLYLMVNQEGGALKEFAEDYVLCQLGTFNPRTAQIVPLEARFIVVGELKNIIKKEEQTS